MGGGRRADERALGATVDGSEGSLQAGLRLEIRGAEPRSTRHEPADAESYAIEIPGQFQQCSDLIKGQVARRKFEGLEAQGPEGVQNSPRGRTVRPLCCLQQAAVRQRRLGAKHGHCSAFAAALCSTARCDSPARRVAGWALGPLLCLLGHGMAHEPLLVKCSVSYNYMKRGLKSNLYCPNLVVEHVLRPFLPLSSLKIKIPSG